MHHFVQYHNVEKMGHSFRETDGRNKLPGRYSIVTRKKPANIINSIVWLVSGEGRPKKQFRLEYWFRVEGVAEANNADDFLLEIYGTDGARFRGGIHLNALPWFPGFFQSQSNFSFGLQTIKAEYVIQLCVTVRATGGVTPADLDLARLQTLEQVDGSSAELLSRLAAAVDGTGYFHPENWQDERERRLRSIVERRGQPEFRNSLITAYGGRCVVTGCDAVDALEAAHIIPYCGPSSDHVTNGLLLRADVHTLFDLDLIGIRPKTLTIVLSHVLEGTSYADLQGKSLRSPDRAVDRPNLDGLAQRWRGFSTL